MTHKKTPLDKIIDLNGARLLPLLGLIWSVDGMSRKDLCGRLGKSKVSVVNDIKRLVDMGCVVEAGSISNPRGRRSSTLKLDRRMFCSAGVSLYHKSLKAVLVDAQSEVVGEISLEDAPRKMPERIDFVVKAIETLLRDNKLGRETLMGVGVALSGIIDSREGRVLSSFSFPEDKDFILTRHIEEKLGVPCRLINAPNLLAGIERTWGKARHMTDFLYFNLGYGLGMMLDGAIYGGSQGRAGEIGYMQLRGSGETDVDGRVGTLKTIASFGKLTSRIESVIAQGGKTLVANDLPPGSKKVSMEMVAKAIEAGDQLCIQLMSETFTIVGEAVLNLAYIFNPEAVFFEPWTGRCPAATIDIVRRMMGHYGIHDWRLSTKILVADCGDDDLARGAALLPAYDYFGLKY